MMLLVVSGASKGFGREASIALASHFRHVPLRIILTARSESGLLQTKQGMEQMLDSCDNDKSQYKSNLNHVKTLYDISIHPMDLSQLDCLESNLQQLVDAAMPMDRYERVIIVNNAGSVGPVGPMTSDTTLSDISAAIQFNITSSIWFSSVWVRALKDHPHTTLINISSLCALQPFPTMATYCTGKAARDMFHATMAKENPNLRFLNYAPGAMQTAMTTMLKESNSLDNELSKWFRSSELIDPMTSAVKLVSIIESNNFLNGSHIDFWDV
jgi:sepiapterin reductase